MRIEVTAEDIARGQPGRPCSCPIALAARAATGKLCMVGFLTIAVDGEEVERKLPPEAQTFVMNFDAGRPVEPFAFEVPD